MRRLGRKARRLANRAKRAADEKRRHLALTVVGSLGSTLGVPPGASCPCGAVAEWRTPDGSLLCRDHALELERRAYAQAGWTAEDELAAAHHIGRSS